MTYEGLIHGLDEDVYHSLPGLSSTGAKKILKSPAHYRHYADNPEPPKQEFDLGSALHTKVLGVGADITIYPDGKGDEEFTFEGQALNNVLSATGARGSKACKAFEDESRAKGLIPVKRAEARVVDLMAESVLSNPTARALIEGGEPEVSMFATDPATVVYMRGRIDSLGRRMGDVKTTSGEASEAGFARQVFNLGYHVQFGHYEHLYELITGDTIPWLFIVVETSAPFLTGVHVLSEDAQRIGREAAKLARHRYAECVETGVWGGYTTRNGSPIGVIDVPMYAVYDYQDNVEGKVA